MPQGADNCFQYATAWSYSLELVNLYASTALRLVSTRVDSGEAMSQHLYLSFPTSSLPRRWIAAGCREWWSFVWPAAPASAVVTPIELTPSEILDCLEPLRESNHVKFRWAEQYLRSICDDLIDWKRIFCWQCYCWLQQPAGVTGQGASHRLNFSVLQTTCRTNGVLSIA